MTSDTSSPLPPPAAPYPPWPVDQAPAWAGQWTPPPAAPLVHRLPQHLAGKALIAAIAAGVLAQWLFAFQILGLNFPLWIAVVLTAAWRFRPTGARFDRLDAWLPISALAFAVFVATRADGMLVSFDVVAAGTLTLVAVVAFGGHRITHSGWVTVAEWAATAVAVFALGAVYVLPGLRPIAAAFGRRREGPLLAVLRGLALALPLLIIFAVLFAAADAVFEAQLRSLLRIDIGPEAVFRIGLAVIAGWLFAGTVTCAWLAGRPQPVASATPVAAAVVDSLRVGRVEALVLLIALDAMFGIFAVLQAAYLFGGLDTFAVSGMTYSDYARRGFFELIIAAALAGLVIIVLDRLVVEHGRAYRVAAAALATLTGAVVLSALVRLGLYQAAYGWTELRFYALAAIGWLALCVVFTLVAVLANRARWLPQLIVGAGLAVALACNFVGPQAFVTDQNVARALNPALVAPGGKTGLDVDYLSFLGTDSVPGLVAARDRLPADVRGQVDQALRDDAAVLARMSERLSWPSWNLSRENAANALVAAGYLTR